MAFCNDPCLMNDRTVSNLCASRIYAYLLGTLTGGPGEREEWLVGADSVKELRTETVRGEARIDRIMLPKVR